MKLDSNRSERRVPMVVLYLVGTMVGAPFFLVAFALSPLSDTWLRFVAPALPFTALVLLWFWARRPSSGGSNIPINVLAQKTYPPGA